MNLNLHGKNALVCGGSKGIGKAAAYELALLGANVTLVARSAQVMEALVSTLPTLPGQQHDFLSIDFTDLQDLTGQVQLLTQQKPIHILINNTGGPPSGAVLNAETDAFLQAFHNHLIANHLLVQAVVSGMRAAGYGRIINVISTSVKAPLANLGVSNTVRGAVASWAKTLANELGPDGITVNNVLPGFTQTERLEGLIDTWSGQRQIAPDELIANMKKEVPLRRFASPEEMGGVIAFLASPAAAYISGTNITVDGGRTPVL